MIGCLPTQALAFLAVFVYATHATQAIAFEWNRGLERYHAALRRRIKVSHQNIYSFLRHLQQITTDQMNDVARIRNGLNIRRPKKKANMLNDKRIKACMSRFSCGAYTQMQFLSAVSHSVGAHTEALRPTEDRSSSSDEAEETQVPVSYTHLTLPTIYSV